MNRNADRNQVPEDNTGIERVRRDKKKKDERRRDERRRDERRRDERRRDERRRDDDVKKERTSPYLLFLILILLLLSEDVLANLKEFLNSLSIFRS